MQCSKHPQTNAQGICTYCGKPFCAECLVEVKGRMYCKDDLGNVIDEAKASALAAPTINITNDNSSFASNINKSINTNKNTNANANINAGYGYRRSSKSKILALILCVFFGYFGAHRFYVGKTGTGVIWLFTVGMFSIGWVVDIVAIFSGRFRDKFGRPLL